MAYTTTARELFDDLPGQLAEHSRLRSVGGVVAFEIKGANGGNWTLDLEKGDLVDGDTRPDCIVSASERDFMALVEGRMSVEDGLLSDRLTVAGDAARLVALMRALAPERR